MKFVVQLIRELLLRSLCNTIVDILTQRLFPDHTVVGSISSTNIKLSDHLNRSSELSLEYLKRLHALHLLIYRFMDYYSHEQPMLDNAQIFSISNLTKFIEYMSSVCHRMELIMETSPTKRLYLATAMMVSGKYKAFYGLRSYILI